MAHAGWTFDVSLDRTTGQTMHWITTTWTSAAMVALTTTGIYLAVIVHTRLAGLRSFSKMSSFDFAMTVAVGSVVASTALTDDPPLLQGVVALSSLFALQLGVAWARERSSLARQIVDNSPVLLMRGSEILDDAMRRTEITRGDLLAKLREANVLHLGQVRAVVLETTGDISVLHVAGGDDTRLDDLLLEGVSGT